MSRRNLKTSFDANVRIAALAESLNLGGRWMELLRERAKRGAVEADIACHFGIGIQRLRGLFDQAESATLRLLIHRDMLTKGMPMKASERLPEWERKFRELVGDAFDEIRVEVFDYNNAIRAGVAMGRPRDGRRYIRWGVQEDPFADDIPASMPPERAAECVLEWREKARAALAKLNLPEGE